MKNVGLSKAAYLPLGKDKNRCSCIHHPNCQAKKKRTLLKNIYKIASYIVLGNFHSYNGEFWHVALNISNV